MSWELWACSPGTIASLTRIDAFFELHRWEPGKPWFSPGYIEWMSKLVVPVYMLERRPEIPASVLYPKDEMLAEYGPYFFTSSLSWMFAKAIAEKPDEIGLWGVDMSATDEYATQRPGCHFFMDVCRRKGIKVTVPPESDLLAPPPLYGFHEIDPMAIKLTARAIELAHRKAAAQQEMEKKAQEVMFLAGAIEDLDYIRKTWLGDRSKIGQ